MDKLCGDYPLAGRIAVSPGELARAVGRAESTIRAWMRDQGLPYSRVGGCVLIHLPQFEKWLLDHQESPRPSLDAEVDKVVEGVFRQAAGR